MTIYTTLAILKEQTIIQVCCCLFVQLSCATSLNRDLRAGSQSFELALICKY